MFYYDLYDLFTLRFGRNFQRRPISRWFFAMAAKPFSCTGILVFVGNLPRIFPMSSLIYASFHYLWGLNLCPNPI